MLRFCFVLMNKPFSALCVYSLQCIGALLIFGFFPRYFCFEMWVYIIIYLFIFLLNIRTTEIREEEETKRNVCQFIYKLPFKCWSIILSNVVLWQIGFCFLKSMMHVRDWCVHVQQNVHLVLYSLCILLHRTRAWKVFVVFLQLHFICKMVQFILRDHVLFWNNLICFCIFVQCECINDLFFVYTRCGPIKCSNLIICDYENQRVIVCESVSNGATVWKRANAKAITRYLFICLFVCCCCFFFKPNYIVIK